MSYQSKNIIVFPMPFPVSEKGMESWNRLFIESKHVSVDLWRKTIELGNETYMLDDFINMLEKIKLENEAFDESIRKKFR